MIGRVAGRIAEDMTVDKLEAVFENEKDTKRTRRYAEVAGDGPAIANTIYLQKAALERLGGGQLPERVRVTVTIEG